jgi:hypothetical protein
MNLAGLGFGCSAAYQDGSRLRDFAAQCRESFLVVNMYLTMRKTIEGWREEMKNQQRRRRADLYLHMNTLLLFECPVDVVFV